ncbi:MAG: signal peptidase II [Gammaproteobacteria bacterium]
MTSVQRPRSAAPQSQEPQSQDLGSFAWFWLSAFVVVADQGTKWLASTYLEVGRPLALLPVFDLSLTHNTGAAFSLLHDAGGWQRWFFVGLAAIISIVLVLWLRHVPRHRRFEPCALALVLGGALGNLWDRIATGAVVDFIHVFWASWHFPAFNVADAAISIGAVMLVWNAWRDRRAPTTADQGP